MIFTNPSWPLRLAEHLGKETERACLTSIRDDAIAAKDREVAHEAQYGIDTGDTEPLRALFEAANSPMPDEPPVWAWCVETVNRWKAARSVPSKIRKAA